MSWSLKHDCYEAKIQKGWRKDTTPHRLFGDKPGASLEAHSRSDGTTYNTRLKLDTLDQQPSQIAKRLIENVQPCKKFKPYRHMYWTVLVPWQQISPDSRQNELLRNSSMKESELVQNITTWIQGLQAFQYILSVRPNKQVRSV